MIMIDQKSSIHDFMIYGVPSFYLVPQGSVWEDHRETKMVKVIQSDAHWVIFEFDCHKNITN